MSITKDIKSFKIVFVAFKTVERQWMFQTPVMFSCIGCETLDKSEAVTGKEAKNAFNERRADILLEKSDQTRNKCAIME